MFFQNLRIALSTVSNIQHVGLEIKDQANRNIEPSPGHTEKKKIITQLYGIANIKIVNFKNIV